MHYEKFQDGTVKCIENEIPFEVPEGWEWTRLSFLAQYRKGPFGSSLTKAMFIPESPTAIKVYEQKNAINKDVTLGTYYISAEKYESMKSFEIFPNDIIVSCAGTIGETFVIPQNMRKGIINQALMKISLYDLGIMNFYLTYFDFVLKDMANEQGYGNALKNIPPFDVLKNYLIPLPPLQEQLLIQEKLSQVLSRIDTIDNKVNIVDKSIEQAKSKILDLAIRGKLVPQDPNDEPASVLLERIRAEKEELIKQGKIKRDKNESIIYKGDDNSYYEKFDDGTVFPIDDALPFVIPSSWSWVRLACLVSMEIKRGKAPKYSEEATNVKVFAQKCNLKAGGINLELAKYLDESALHRYPLTEFLAKGDVNINSTGTGTLGRVGIICDEVEPIVPDSHITVIRTSPLILSHYIYCVLKENQPVLENSGEGSTNQKELRPGTLINFLVPLPPMNEQKRITKMITESFSSIKAIAQILN